MTGAFAQQHCNEIWKQVWKQIKGHPNCQRKQKNQHCVYVEVVRKNVVEPYISICVRDPSDDCRVGFRGTEPWRITGDYVADMGSAVVKCGNEELRVVQSCIWGIDPFRASPLIEPYNGARNIAIHVWWKGCVRIVIDGISYCVCPQVMAQQQGKKRGLGRVVRWLGEKVLLCLTRLRSRDRVGATAEGCVSQSQQGDIAKK